MLGLLLKTLKMRRNTSQETEELPIIFKAANSCPLATAFSSPYLVTIMLLTRVKLRYITDSGDERCYARKWFVPLTDNLCAS